MLRDYIAMAGEVLAETGAPRQGIVGIGVGCGGPLDPDTGVVYSPPNLPGWDSVPVTAVLGGALDLPAWLENDANAAALAEYTYGAGRGADPLVYLTISTGIGAGIVIGGALYRGATGNAGELGHLIVCAGGRPCGCGGRGCVEAYCSGSSIAARAHAALEQPDGASSALSALGALPRAEDVVALARAGDLLARALWDETVELLAAGLVNAIHAFEPRRVVLGGGVTRAGDDLLVPLRQRVYALGMQRLVDGVEIVKAACGDQVGLLGAAAVAFAAAGGG